MAARPNAALATGERIAIALSRELEGAGTMLIGAASAVPLAAGLLAQALHTPALTILGAGVYINPRRLVADLSAGWDCRPVAIGDMSDVFAITELGIDVMFYGGMQLDRFGCVNLHYVNTSSGRLRGPGLANTSLGHTARRTLLYTERHDRRTLVEQVEYASVIGHAYRGRTRRQLGLPNAGPTALVTPDVLFRPAADGVLTPDRALRDLDWPEVRERTGWSLPEAPPVAFEPTAEEIELLRGSIDSGGLLSERG
jgi:glutaconate CoA-transferase, subunit B